MECCTAVQYVIVPSSVVRSMVILFVSVDVATLCVVYQPSAAVSTSQCAVCMRVCDERSGNDATEANISTPSQPFCVLIVARSI